MSIPPASTSTYTRDLRHLFSSVVLRRALAHPTPQQKRLWNLEHIKVVPDQRRILQWNIVPGDFVRRLPDRFKPNDDPERFEVLSVDKYQNKVFLKGNKHRDGSAKSFPYSLCQLYIGDFYVNNKSKQRTSVYAKRVGSTNLKYNWRTKRFEWVRYAEATTPRISFQGKRGYRIPWPKEQQPEYRGSRNEFYDTMGSDAHEMSWAPFTPGKKVPKYLENEYISNLYNHPEEPAEWQASIPIEHLMARELVNPLSRARRQERWQKTAAIIEDSKVEFVKRELQDLHGRRRQDAKRDGVFRWKMAVQKYKARVRWQRWVKRGGKSRLEVRVKRRHSRSVRKLRRLRSLRLVEAQNQVIPAAERRGKHSD
ncbi:hypothetical protein FRC14_003453 [Serendipita sp. 396]|nr:hypothetical protein FRC14_003453 [Serendipita sp. 396]KAG8787587.1 hypothetical protein FRC15_008836 [Serendipita sp. 397]KAG8803326.1 hypothetical protein FRC16_006071 [Serendipita sp. 398]KAG8827095.1 hypothetical protein FRC19_005523 [Serendipita sp. 401]KAG8837232.1 hypothetical protein FRC18_009752 [Serendipita sp. 400]KAG8876234.1 hypothetical protein FRC20_002206 [Serendipita sp. 405]KAG9056499.1 hypothetical protein FS842_010466 [Serendipita sp. 407]